MRVVEVKYDTRRSIGQYEHEELSCTVIVEEGDDATEAMSLARATCVKNTTSYLKAKKEREK